MDQYHAITTRMSGSLGQPSPKVGETGLEKKIEESDLIQALLFIKLFVGVALFLLGTSPRWQSIKHIFPGYRNSE